ncbi:MAG: M16 family metallopeptidase [Planctomycetota bacterium]|jgi:predicted Zn-dependent peptidase
MAVEFKHHELANGLTIIGEVNDEAHTAAAGFFVKTGSRDETVELMGVSHFLEHMMFKGTERRSAADVNREFDLIGANYNASTSQEVTNYYAHVLPEYMPQTLDLLSDILRPSLRQEDFDMEKNVIQEEIGMYADRPFWMVYERAMENYFGDHPLGYRVLGTEQSVGALTRDQMMDYFEHRYCPDNIVVSLAGKVDFDRCVEQLAEACGGWRRTGATRDYSPPPAHPGVEDMTADNVNMFYLVGMCPGPTSQDDERYAAAILAQILGDSDGSRLYWKLIEPGLADEAELSHHPHDRVGAFMYYASCDPSRADEVQAGMTEVLDTASQDLNEGEIERAVSKIAMSLTLQNERPAGRMMGLGAQWTYQGEYTPLDEILRKVEAVDLGALQDLLSRWTLSPRTVVRLGASQ